MAYVTNITEAAVAKSGVNSGVNSAANSAARAPLIFTFHGTGGDEHQFHGLAHGLVPQAAVLSPRGDVSEGGANRYFRRTGEGVYDMADLAARTTAMADWISREKAARKPSVTIGIGYSNGANILASVTFAAPALFDRLVLLHPLIPFDPPPQPGLAGRQVLLSAGRTDPVCPTPLTQRLADWYQAQGAVVSLNWHDGGHEIRQTEVQAIAAFLADLG